MLLVLLAWVAVMADAAWDKTKPASGAPLVSADFRNNWAELEKSGNAVTMTRDPVLGVWNAGTTAAPSNYTLAGTGATIVRTGTGEADTTRQVGKYAAKVTFGSATATLCQDVWSTTTFDTGLRGRTFSAGLWAKTSTASQVRAQIDDGVGTTNTAYHSGGGAFEWLTATRTLDTSATKLTMCFRVESAGAAYASAYTLVIGALPPDDYRPPILQYSFSTGVFTGVGATYYTASTAAFTKNANTTLSDVTGLAFPVSANEVTAFRFVLKGVSTTTADWKFALTGPASPTAVWYGAMSSMDVPTTAAVAAFGSAVAAGGATVEDTLIVHGLLRNGANAGTVQLQAAQQTSDATNTIIRAESYVLAERVQ